MPIKTLFQTWNALREKLIDPNLSDDEMDRLVDQSMHIIRAMAHTPSNSLMDVLLKLEIYGREVEAGPCEECDALLGSALRDRIAILGHLGTTGLAAAERDEHRPGPLQERASQDDTISLYAARRGQDSGSPHP